MMVHGVTEALQVRLQTAMRSDRLLLHSKPFTCREIHYGYAGRPWIYGRYLEGPHHEVYESKYIFEDNSAA